ncbi:MAG TPA: Arm DNA-binding domain-containing protein, partial [Ferrovibrio sp.]|uniref:Arm DNA-binding domain-containing protein n=1 Tax=Ferrovibrio sp. TaxID=1917215 RepID=UPI002ECFF199
MVKKLRSLARFTARELMSITEPGHYHDGGGLYVHVTKNGGRSWIFRYSVVDASGKRRGRDMGLGPLKDV